MYQFCVRWTCAGQFVTQTWNMMKWNMTLTLANWTQHVWERPSLWHTVDQPQQSSPSWLPESKGPKLAGEATTFEVHPHRSSMQMLAPQIVGPSSCWRQQSPDSIRHQLSVPPHVVTPSIACLAYGRCRGSPSQQVCGIAATNQAPAGAWPARPWQQRTPPWSWRCPALRPNLHEWLLRTWLWSPACSLEPKQGCTSQLAARRKPHSSPIVCSRCRRKANWFAPSIAAFHSPTPGVRGSCHPLMPTKGCCEWNAYKRWRLHHLQTSALPGAVQHSISEWSAVEPGQPHVRKHVLTQCLSTNSGSQLLALQNDGGSPRISKDRHENQSCWTGTCLQNWVRRCDLYKMKVAAISWNWCHRSWLTEEIQEGIKNNEKTRFWSLHFFCSIIKQNIHHLLTFSFKSGPMAFWASKMHWHEPRWIQKSPWEWNEWNDIRCPHQFPTASTAENGCK